MKNRHTKNQPTNEVKRKARKRIQRAKNAFWQTLKNIEVTNFNELEFDY